MVFCHSKSPVPTKEVDTCEDPDFTYLIEDLFNLRNWPPVGTDVKIECTIIDAEFWLPVLLRDDDGGKIQRLQQAELFLRQESFQYLLCRYGCLQATSDAACGRSGICLRAQRCDGSGSLQIRDFRTTRRKFQCIAYWPCEWPGQMTKLGGDESRTIHCLWHVGGWPFF